MLEIISIKSRTPEQVDTDKVKYIENSPELNSMCKKYNYAIENFVLDSKENIICFRHDDTTILSEPSVVNYKLNKVFRDKSIGVVGVIGTFQISNLFHWWLPHVNLHGIGRVIQGGVDDNGNKIEYDLNRGVVPMNDYVTSVDGCILFFNKQIFVDGLRFDENIEKYDFYDVDICLQILEMDKKVAVVDILVKHESQGVLGDDINLRREYMINKWSPKVGGKFPITYLTKFI